MARLSLSTALQPGQRRRKRKVNERVAASEDAPLSMAAHEAKVLEEEEEEPVGVGEGRRARGNGWFPFASHNGVVRHQRALGLSQAGGS